MNIAALLSTSASNWPDHPAIARGATIVKNYAEHGKEVANLAGGLIHSLDLKTGDRAVSYTHLTLPTICSV